MFKSFFKATLDSLCFLSRCQREVTSLRFLYRSGSAASTHAALSDSVLTVELHPLALLSVSSASSVAATFSVLDSVVEEEVRDSVLLVASLTVSVRASVALSVMISVAEADSSSNAFETPFITIVVRSPPSNEARVLLTASMRSVLSFLLPSELYS